MTFIFSSREFDFHFCLPLNRHWKRSIIERKFDKQDSKPTQKLAEHLMGSELPDRPEIEAH